MPKSLRLPAGMWWRFERYEIQDNHIRPAPGAALREYDPWKEYQASLKRAATAPRPYLTLMSLLDEVFELGSRWDLLTGELLLEKEAEALVLDWCKRHGLLGILPQQAHKVELAARWWPPGNELEDAEEPTLVPTLRDYSRRGADWVEDIWQPPMGMHITDPKRRGQLLSRAESGSNPDWPIREAGVVWEKWDEPEPGLSMPKERLDQEWASYFPTVPRRQAQTYPYPRPLSEDFWHCYAEPVPRFLTQAHVLKGALHHLTPLKEMRGQVKNMTDQQYMSIRGQVAGPYLLEGHLRSLSPTLELCRDGSLRQRWVAPSLLASFAMMALQDLTGDSSILECKNCKTLFTSTKYQARYCTDKCRQTAQKRRYRAKKKTTNGPKQHKR